MPHLYLSEGKSIPIQKTALLAQSIILLASIPDLYFQLWTSLWYVPLGTAICMTSLILNKKRRIVTAGNVFSAGISLLIFALQLTAPKETYIYLYYLPFVIGLPFFIDYTNKRTLLLHIAHVFTGWLILIFADTSAFDVYHISKAESTVIGQLNILFVVAGCQFFVWQIIYVNKKTEREILQSEQTLRQNNDELRKGNQELDTFVYSISHDLRAPLASVLGLTNLLHHDIKAPEVPQYTSYMQQSLARMDIYIQDILTYSRNTRLEIHREKINLKAELSAAIDYCIHQCVGRQPEVEIEVQSSASGSFYTDPYRLQTLLQHILNHSFRYFNPRIQHNQVSVRAQVTDHQAIIYIWDNGLGIAADEKEKIFHMFHRSEVSRPGSGLGLYIARECATRLKGTIRVESIVNMYTEFVITLPNLKPEPTGFEEA